MLTKNLKSFAAMCLISSHVLNLSTAFAAGGGGSMDGGGGDTVSNRNTGELVSIADPFATRSIHGKRFILPKDVVEELTKISSIASGYFFTSLLNLTDNTNVDYMLVENLPALPICQERIQYRDLNDANLQVTPTACTSGRKTWIKKSDYEKLISKPSKRELVLLLVHEGLRRVPNLTGDDLVAITNGLRVVMMAHDTQTNGKMTALNSDEKNNIISMVESILYNRLSSEASSVSDAKRVLASYHVNEYGALISNTADVDKSAVVGVGSLITHMIRVNKNVVLVGASLSKIYMSSRYRAMSHLESLSGLQSEVPENVKIINSKVEFYPGAILSENSTILNSSLKLGLDCNLGSSATILNSNVNCYGKIGSNAKISDSYIPTLYAAGENLNVSSSKLVGKFELANDVSIEASEIKFQTSWIYSLDLPNDVRLKNFKDVTIIDNSGRASLLGPLFKEGAKIDLQGKYLCKESTNHFENMSGFGRRIKNESDLARYCVK